MCAREPIWFRLISCMCAIFSIQWVCDIDYPGLRAVPKWWIAMARKWVPFGRMGMLSPEDTDRPLSAIECPKLTHS